MSVDEIKRFLFRAFVRFYGDGYICWDKKSLEETLRFPQSPLRLDSSEVQQALKELEKERRIKLFYQEENYLQVLEPKINDPHFFA